MDLLLKDEKATIKRKERKRQKRFCRLFLLEEDVNKIEQWMNSRIGLNFHRD